MSNAASQAAAFYRDVAKSRRVWTARDAEGFPCPETSTGKRSMPFWSSEGRVRRVIESVPAFSGFEPVEFPWEEFCDRWLAGLKEDGFLVGVNWSGPSATGYDVEPDSVRANVEHYMLSPGGSPATGA